MAIKRTRGKSPENLKFSVNFWGWQHARDGRAITTKDQRDRGEQTVIGWDKEGSNGQRNNSRNWESDAEEMNAPDGKFPDLTWIKLI